MGTKRPSAFPDCSITASTLPIIQVVLKRVLETLNWLILFIPICKASGLGIVIPMPFNFLEWWQSKSRCICTDFFVKYLPGACLLQELCWTSGMGISWGLLQCSMWVPPQNYQIEAAVYQDRQGMPMLIEFERHWSRVLCSPPTREAPLLTH